MALVKKLVIFLVINTFCGNATTLMFYFFGAGVVGNWAVLKNKVCKFWST